MFSFKSGNTHAGQHSAVGNVPDCRCMSQTAYPGVASSILAQSHTFAQIDH